VISQSSLQSFQEEMGKALKDPYKVFIQILKVCLILPAVLLLLFSGDNEADWPPYITAAGNFQGSLIFFNGRFM